VFEIEPAALAPQGGPSDHFLLGAALAEIALLPETGQSHSQLALLVRTPEGPSTLSPSVQVGVVSALRLVADILRETAHRSHRNVMHFEVYSESLEGGPQSALVHLGVRLPEEVIVA
jgi:hypothetical protein